MDFDHKRLENTIDIMLQMQAKTDCRLEETALTNQELALLMKGTLSIVEKLTSELAVFLRTLREMVQAAEIRAANEN